MIRKKYHTGGPFSRESQIANANMANPMMQGKDKSWTRDLGNLFLDSVTSSLEGITGQSIFDPEYTTKSFGIAGNTVNTTGHLVGQIGMNALTGGLANGASASMFRKGGLLTDINGPSHEEGGMVITPNAEAEGGETKYEDYIFSDTLKVDGKKTFAQKSKSIRNRFKLRPNDKLSKEAEAKELTALMQEQELLKAKDEFNTLAEEVYRNGGRLKLPLGGLIDPNSFLMPPDDAVFDFTGADGYFPEPVSSKLAPPVIGDDLGTQFETQGKVPASSSTNMYTSKPSLLPLISSGVGNIAKGIMLAKANKGRLNPNVSLDKLNYTPAVDVAQANVNNSIAAGMRSLRDNATSSGQFLANAGILASNAGAKGAETISDIIMRGQNANTGIANEEATRNNAIAAQNNLILDQAEANTVNQAAGLIDNTIGATQQYGKDLQTQQYMDIAANNILPAGAKYVYKKDPKTGKRVLTVQNNTDQLAKLIQLYLSSNKATT